MNNELKIIQPPPLSQSMYETMACPASYQAQYIFGVHSPPNELSELSKEIHACMLLYTSHLRAAGLAEDWAYFESLMPQLSTEAQAGVRGFIGSMKFDPRTILTTEERFYDSDAEGTPDLITMETQVDATIWDYKNYFEIIEAETFQSKLYPLLLLRHNPSLESVRFVLVFMRYGKTREVTWSRDHVPYLERVLANARARQADIHRTKGLAQAIPGKACEYCPLLRTARCQVNDVNPYAAMNAEDRLSYVLFLRSALRNNMVILRDQARFRTIATKDANGKQYEAAFVPAERRLLPCNEAFFEALDDHKYASGEDLRDKVNISRTSLASLRKAKKRVLLDQRLTDIEVVKPTTTFKITKLNPEIEEEHAEEYAQ
jgi:hypothetical protein